MKTAAKKPPTKSPGIPLEIIVHPKLTYKQEVVISSKSPFLLMTGVAGTAKTYTAIAKALTWLRGKQVHKILIIRSAVAVRNIGFLPGDHDDKGGVYEAPYKPLFDSLVPKGGYKALNAAKLIDFELTSFLRGQTLEDTAIIVDEYQNMGAKELQTIVTRVGDGSRMILCGDTDQCDLPNWEANEHLRVIDVLKRMELFHVVEFETKDIVRSPFVKAYYETKALFSQSM